MSSNSTVTESPFLPRHRSYMTLMQHAVLTSLTEPRKCRECPPISPSLSVPPLSLSPSLSCSLTELIMWLFIGWLFISVSPLARAGVMFFLRRMSWPWSGSLYWAQLSEPATFKRENEEGGKTGTVVTETLILSSQRHLCVFQCVSQY